MKRQGKVNDVVLVTGVGPGTGKAIVERFAASGTQSLLARSAQRLNDIARATPNTIRLFAMSPMQTDSAQ